MTQEEVAKLAGQHANYVNSLKRGERNVSLLNIWRIANGLGLGTEQLVLGLPGSRRNNKLDRGQLNMARWRSS